MIYSDKPHGRRIHRPVRRGGKKDPRIGVITEIETRFPGWSPAQVLAEMRRRGHSGVDEPFVSAVMAAGPVRD